jgi:hypothetical protein
LDERSVVHRVASKTLQKADTWVPAEVLWGGSAPYERGLYRSGLAREADSAPQWYVYRIHQNQHNRFTSHALV